MTEIADVINVTVNVADAKVTRAGFGVPLIFDTFADTIFAERVRQYPNLAAVAVDFATTSKVYKAAQALFSQSRAPTVIKVGRGDAGDATITDSLNAIEQADSDFYGLVSTNKAEADILLIAAWTEARSKMYFASSEDADVIASGSADIASLLQALGYNRTSYMHHHQAGVDVTGATYVIASGVATIGQVAHGLRVGDPVTFLGSAGVLLIDGDQIVATVPDTDTYTFTTTLADQTSAAVNYFARYTFPEAAWIGYMLPSDPGSETWKFKTLAGVVPVPRDLLNPTEEANALGKNANLYTDLAGSGSTHEGVCASGRYIDIQRSIDWMEARLGEAAILRLKNSPKVPYTDSGVSVLYAEYAGVMDLAERRGVIGEILDDSGDVYRINMPKVSSQLPADRVARDFKDTIIECQIAGALHKLELTVNAKV